MKKLSFIVLATLFALPQLGARSEPENYSRSGHIGHYLYYVISAPVETKVGEEAIVRIEVWSSYDIVLTRYKVRIFGAGTAYEESSDKSTNLPQGAGIPSTIAFKPSSEGMVYLEVKAEYDLSMGGQRQQGYGDATMPLAYARTQTFDELKAQNQELSEGYYNYAELEQRYLELRAAFEEVQANVEVLTASYAELEAAYNRLQDENRAMRENYEYLLAQLGEQENAVKTYEYLAVSSAAAAVIAVLAAAAARRRAAAGKAPGRRTQASSLGKFLPNQKI
ncbi:MAG: hypothetical protein QXF24_09810 [Thermoproteota archaeon]